MDFCLFDNINTTAVHWLTWNSMKYNQPLGIKKFNRKNKIHLWLLHIMNSFSIGEGYKNFYIDCSLIDYMYIKYIKKIHQIKRVNNKNDVFLIEPELFAKEVCEQFNKESIIVEDIYNQYWSK